MNDFQQDLVQRLTRIETLLEPLPGSVSDCRSRLEKVERMQFKAMAVVALIAAVIGFAGHSLTGAAKAVAAVLGGYG